MTDVQIEPIPEVSGPFEPVGIVSDDLTARMRELQAQGDADPAASQQPASDFQPEAAFSGVGLISVPQATGSIAQIMARAVAWLESQVGVMMETPPGSNIVGVWDDVYPAFMGEAWCVGLGVDAYARQGVDFRPLIADCYYCPAWEQFAKDWGVWHTYGSGYSPVAGDVALMGRNGLATHFGTASPKPGNYAGYRQVEGNTVAEGATGSQTNGIGTYVRYRSDFIRGWIDMHTLIQKLVNAGKMTIAAPKPAVAHAPAVQVHTAAAPASSQLVVSLNTLDANIRAGGTAPSIAIVQGWLGIAQSRTWDAATKAAYAAWQRQCGYSGADADGVPGHDSLAKLAAAHGGKAI